MRVRRGSAPLRSTPRAPEIPARGDAATGVAPELRAQVRGLAERAALLTRSAGPEGSEPLLNARELARLDHALARLDPRLSPRLEAALRRAGSALRQGLVLRALAARAETASDGFAILEAFAARLAGMSDAEAARRATVSDLDSTTNDHGFDPVKLWEKRGVIHDRTAGDERGDNDGLFQRFTASCGPTTLQIMMAEADPVMAFAIHDTGLVSDATDDVVADFQRALLESMGGISIGRREALLRARLRNATGRLDDDGQRDSVRRWALQGGPFDRDARRGLHQLRRRFGFPSPDELRRLKKATLPRADAGTSSEAFLDALNANVGPLTGTRYRTTGIFARGQVWRHLDDMARALRQGHDVPFGIAEPGHWMCATACRGRKPKRDFLLVDPWSGRTAWVGERAFIKGQWAADAFDLAGAGERPYVEELFLP